MTAPATKKGAAPGPRPVPDDAATAKTKPTPTKKHEPSKKVEPAPKPVADGKVIERLRRQRMMGLAKRFALFVLLPTVLSAIYFGAIASDQYESHAQFTVHSVEAKGGVGLDGLLGGLAGGASRDTLIVRDHILSRDMLAELDEELSFTEIWKSEAVDPIARMPQDASFEEAFEHYQDHVFVEYDSNSGVLTLVVRAPDATQAKTFAEAILAHSENRVNELSLRERADRTRYAEEQVAKSEARLAEARQAVLEQQQNNAELSPQAEAGASMAIRTSLESELARARANLMELQSFMTADAPKVKAARERVKALSAQVGAEKSRVVGPKGDGGFAKSMAEFEAAMVEKEFAEAAYRSAMTTLELARADAARQHRYLAIIAAPSLPDESTYPERGLGVLTVFLMSFLLMGIGSLLIASVREHARV